MGTRPLPIGGEKMVNTDSLLQRPGLPPDLRLLVLFKACIWPGDTALQSELIGRAKGVGLSRSELEEAILQATLFFGFPRAVSAFEVLNERWPIDKPPSGSGLPESERMAAGRRLFASIYGRNDTAVREMLRSFHGEFHDFVLEAAYGRILSRPGLPPRTRELLAVGALAQLDQWPQLVAHARGAMQFGASELHLTETVYTVTLDEGHAIETARRLTRLSRPASHSD